MHRGFIVVWRKILDWGWYSDPATKDLFLHLILTANNKDSEYKGHIIPRGSLVTGRKVLAKTLGFTERNIRTALTNLKTTNEIAIKTTSKFSIITITRYEEYQSLQEKRPSKRPSNLPTSDQQTTTSKPYNHDNKRESTFTPPSLEAVREYIRMNNYSVDPDKFFSYFEASGWVDSLGHKVKNWKQKVITWSNNKEPKEKDPMDINGGKGWL